MRFIPYSLSFASLTIVEGAGYTILQLEKGEHRIYAVVLPINRMPIKPDDVRASAQPKLNAVRQRLPTCSTAKSNGYAFGMGRGKAYVSTSVRKFGTMVLAEGEQTPKKANRY